MPPGSRDLFIWKNAAIGGVLLRLNKTRHRREVKHRPHCSLRPGGPKLTGIMKKLLTAIAVFATFILAPEFVPAANVADFIDFSLRNGRNQVILPGRLYVPPEASSDPTTPRPLFILFLHGAGEDGTNNISQVNVNLDNRLAEAKRHVLHVFMRRKPSITGAARRLLQMCCRWCKPRRRRWTLTPIGYT